MRSFRYITGLAAIAGLLSFNGCKREFDNPPEKIVPEGTVMDIKTLKSLYNNAIVRFTEDKSIYGIVTADEKGGNFYKQIYVQDSTGAILLNLLSSGGVYRGDSVRLALKGARLIYSNGMYQLDSMNVDNNIFKQAAGKTVTPKTVTLNDLQSVPEKLKGVLVKVNNVQFSCSDVGSTYADAVTFSTANKTIEDCNGKSLIMRTSGYASFASTAVKKGNGSLTGIIAVYNTTPQLYIRDLNDVLISDNNNDRCAGTSCNFYLKKDFEDQSTTSGAWVNVNVTGSTNWTTNSQGAVYGSYYAQCSNYNPSGPRPAAETWLISPSVNLSAATNPVFSFEHATNYSGPAMEVYISLDYVSGPPSSASWTPLSYTPSSGGFAWQSNVINISTYKSSNVHVAFKYSGTTSQGATWEIDDILIKEQ
jgi:hypothetical protein